MAFRSSKSDDTNSSIAGAALVILIAMVASKFASFVSEAILAYYLGTSTTGDAYYMVSGIQQVLYPMLSVGIWKLFLPEYKKALALNGVEASTAYANKCFTLFVGFSMVFTALLAVFARPVVLFAAPGFDDATADLCTELVRISSPMYIFIIASSVYATMLQCHGKFFASQVREIATHLPVILAALLFFREYGVYALAVGLLVGGLVRLLVELPSMDWGYRFKLDLSLRDKRVVGLLRNLPSALVSSGADQIIVLVNKVMASSQSVGSVSALNYASKLQSLFVGLFSSALSTACYPKMAEYAAMNEKRALAGLVGRAILLVTAFLVPLSVGTAMYGRELVGIVFERGAFGADATQLTAGAYSFYAVGLPFVALFSFYNNLLYVLNMSGVVMRLSLASMAINVTLSLALTPFFGVGGLALASSVAYLIVVVAQIVLCRRHLGLSVLPEWRELAKVVGTSVVSFVVALPLAGFFSSNLLRLCTATVVVIILYALLLIVFKSVVIDELKQAIGEIRHHNILERKNR